MPELSNSPLDINNKTWNLAAGDGLEIAGNNATGFSVISATANFEISLDQGPFCEAFAGLQYNAPEGRAIQSIRIRNSSGAANAIGFMWGKGRFDDARLALIASVAVSNFGFAQVAAPTGGTIAEVVCAAGARTQIAGSAANRNTLKVASPITNLGSVRMGGSSVLATSGIPLEPGESTEFNTQQAVHVWNPNAYPVTICVHNLLNP